MSDKKDPAVNELGNKFWLEEDLTEYAKRVGLGNLKVLLVEEPGGLKTRIIVNEKREPIYENPSMEAMAYHLDMLAFIKRDEEKDKS